MAMAFYSQDDTFIDWEYYLAFIELAPESLCYLDSFDMAEGQLLGRWVESCQGHRLAVGHFFDDTLLRCAEIPIAMRLLEHAYQHLTGRTLLRDDPETPHNPYRKMYTVLHRAHAEGRGLVGLCD